MHPDVHVLAPEGAAGYLVEQVRDVVSDIYLTSIEGGPKVYIFDRAETLNPASANAFLKSLEEPPDDVVIVLLAEDPDSVIDTIASRCQIVRFQRVPEARAVEVLVQRTGAPRDEALEALAATGGVLARAAAYLASPSRRAARELAVRVLPNLPLMDAADVLDAARRAAGRRPGAARGREGGPGGREPRPRRVPRQDGARRARDRGSLQARTDRSRARGVARSAPRRGELAARLPRAVAGTAELAVNRDVVDTTEPVARVMTPQAAVRALGAVDEARRLLSRNVTPQLVVETMLFDIREVLTCPR